MKRSNRAAGSDKTLVIVFMNVTSHFSFSLTEKTIFQLEANYQGNDIA